MTSLADIWPNYARWNTAIGEEFFSGSWKGQPVYLDLSPETLTRIADRVGIARANPESEFVRVIKATLSLPPTETRVFEAHRVLLKTWEQTQHREPPWCVGLLAFFSLVAEGMARDELFSAANYYGRLGELLGTTDEAGMRKVRRDFRLDAHALWDSLNSWLDDTEHAFGRPTAHAFDRRRHVGIPISQALVKEHDRRHFREFFEEYRLGPRQRLPLSEITRLLEDWLPRSHVSKALKALWRQPEARERIAGIAQVELEAWNGEVDLPDTGSRREAALLLAASLREHPVPQLDLAVLLRRLDAIPRGRYQLPANSARAAHAAFRLCGGAVHVKECGLEDWLEIAESADISMPDLLLTSVELHSAGDQAFLLTRAVRRLVVLKREEVYRLLIESARAELGETLLLLAHKSLAQELDTFLSGISRQGYRRASAGALRGLPEDWVAFRDVVITAVAESPIDDLNALTPLAMTQISLAGGFFLPARSTWHSAHPPEARILALDEPEVRAALVSTQLLGSRQHPDDGIDLGMFTKAGVIDLARLQPPLADGDYRLVLERAGEHDQNAEKVLTSVGFRLRSGNHPRPAVASRVPALEHDFVRPGWAAISATAVRDTAARVSVVGAVVHPARELAPDHTQGVGPLPPPRPTMTQVADPESEALTPQRATRAESETPPCLAGVHYFWLPTFAPNRRGPVQVAGRCRHCGLEKWYFRRDARRQARHSNVDEERAAPQARSPLPLPPAEHRDIGWDDLLDALAYARAGTWESFVGLAGQLDDSPWFAIETARMLSALGHLDIALDERTLRPEAWSMPPPTLALLDGSHAVLCGSRSRRLLARLHEDVASIGGEMQVLSSAFGPSVVRVQGLDGDGIKMVAQSVESVLRIPVRIAGNTPQRLLEILPTLHELARALPALSWPLRSAELYDVRSAAWQPVRVPDQPGAYRFRVQPWLYAYVSAEDIRGGRAHVGDARLVKHLAAIESGASLIGYDQDRQCLLAPWGGQLPGLYERVAALCSGEPPVKMDDGMIVYPAVPPSVAAVLWTKLKPTQ